MFFNVTLRVHLPFVLLLKRGTYSSQLRSTIFNSSRSILWTSAKFVRRLFFRLYMFICFVSLLFRHQRLSSFAYTNKPRWIPIKFAGPWFFSQTASALHTALNTPPPWALSKASSSVSLLRSQYVNITFLHSFSVSYFSDWRRIICFQTDCKTSWW
jgi:hypothetical protein